MAATSETNRPESLCSCRGWGPCWPTPAGCLRRCRRLGKKRFRTDGEEAGIEQMRQTQRLFGRRTLDVV